MTQAGNLRNYGDDFAAEPMTTRAVELGEILSFWDPDGVGHSPSGPNRPREIRTTSAEKQEAWSSSPVRYSVLGLWSSRTGSREQAGRSRSILTPLWSVVGGKKEV
jgi:hypothetical protein